MTDKIMTAAQAVEKFVKNGDQIALGGFTVNRNPMYVIREIIRQKKNKLYLVVHSHGQGMELLIGAGCVERIELAYGGVARFAPTGNLFKKAFKDKTIEVEDYSNYQMTLRFMAGAMGLPFIATKSGLESDIVRKFGFSQKCRGQGQIPKHKLKVMDDPINENGGKVVVLPPLNPDVALMHVQYVGEKGTCRITGLSFADIEQAKAAKKVIVSCEEIVPEDFIRRDPDRNSLAHFLVDAIIPAPFGAHPTACHTFYDYDPNHFNMFKKTVQNKDSFQKYLDDWVYPLETMEDYLTKVGFKDLLKIKSNSALGYAPGLDRR
jgi:glutaconate CoA-transferase subunit A